MARAWLSAFGIPANAPKDAVYPVGLTDADGKPLDASKNNYVIHFASKDDLPPAEGFWSPTMYDSGYFFVPNPLNRAERAQPAQDQRRRFDRPLPPEGKSRPGQGSELAPRSGRLLHSDVPSVLAEGDSAVGAGRYVVAARHPEELRRGSGRADIAAGALPIWFHGRPA